MTQITTAARASEHSVRWRWFLALGVLLLLLGLTGVSATTLVEVSSLLVFAPLLLASSILQVLMAFFVGKEKEYLLHLISAGVEAAVGFLLIGYPLQVFADGVVVIALFLLVSGVVRLIRSLVTHGPGQNWMFLAAAGALLLGVFVWLRVPVTKFWLAGLCLAVDFLCHGLCWSAVALRERNPLSQT